MRPTRACCCRRRAPAGATADSENAAGPRYAELLSSDAGHVWQRCPSRPSRTLQVSLHHVPPEASISEKRSTRRAVLWRAVGIPLAVLACIAGLYGLMLAGYLTLTAWLLALAIVGLLAAAVWEWRRRERRWSALLTVGALVVAGTVGFYGWNLNEKLKGIARLDVSVLSLGERPDPQPVDPETENQPLNIIVMGADNPNRLVEKPTIAELLEDGTWDPGAYRSDTIMVVHLPADRESAYVVSVPRDSYVQIYDAEGEPQGRNKINAAFAEYGPLGTLRTVENLSDLRMDHMAIVDFAGFKDITSAIGGVDVYLPEDVYDVKQDQAWEQGWNHLEGELALKYVRQRSGLANGDFDRVDRQQNFLRAVLEKLLDNGTIGNPVKLTNTLEAVAGNLTVDEDWSNGEIRGLALGMRDLESDRVRFVTLPLDRYETIEGVGSANIIARRQARELWRAVEADRIGRYLNKYPGEELEPPRQIS